MFFGDLLAHILFSIIIIFIYTPRIIINTICYFITVIATYEKSTQHTYLPMSISAVTFAIVTISVVLCYKWMSSQFRYISLFRPGFYPVADQASINRNEGIYVLALIIIL